MGTTTHKMPVVMALHINLAKQSAKQAQRLYRAFKRSMLIWIIAPGKEKAERTPQALCGTLELWRSFCRSFNA